MVELSSIIVLGILAQWIAWRTKVPAILPLILIGLLVGPFSTLWTVDGTKWIQPMYEGGKGLFPDRSLFYFVSLSIGIILFEGGLTLNRKEVVGLGPSIVKLITLGSVITFIGSALVSWLVLGLSWPTSFLFGALIIVTGPTVIAPILRNVPVKKDIATVLKWEGILIDPIGALAAVLVFEFISSGAAEFTTHALLQFGKIMLVGTSIGFVSAYGLYFLLKKKLIPHYLLNVFTLALVLMVFVGSDVIAHESGLLTVVIMGTVLGNLNVPNLKEILYFKESLSILLISILFILLSANMNLSDLQLLLDWKYLILFLLVILVIRPLAVFLSTTSSSLSRNDKMFISWVGPRGIVAAGIASLFGMKLIDAVNTGKVDLPIEEASVIAPLVFLIVLGTVLLNATTANLVAKGLGVLQKASDGILILGGHQAARLLGKYLSDNGRNVVIIDNNGTNIKMAQALGIKAYQYNIYSDELANNYELNDIGYLMALTGSLDVNKYALDKFSESLGTKGSYRLVSSDEMIDPNNNPSSGLFSNTDDYINFSEVARDYPVMNELALESIEHYKTSIEKIHNETSSIPVFIHRLDGAFDIIPSNAEDVEYTEGSKLVYLGKSL